MKATKTIEQEASDYEKYVRPLIVLFPHLQRSYTDAEIVKGAKEFAKNLQEFASGAEKLV